MDVAVPRSWHPLVAAELDKPYFRHLEAFLAEDGQSHTIYPPEQDIFNALRLTPYDTVRVLILGQDPYHNEGQAHGLAFSVRPGVKAPPSLANIFKELRHDIGCPIPSHGYLAPWAERGVLLLNTVLTVRAHEANSHKGKGWERFTDAVIQALSGRETPVVFVLWGSPAQKKVGLIDTTRHTIIQSVHPSPLSARSGFFGSKPFSQINAALRAAGAAEVDWCLPTVVNSAAPEFTGVM
jgi:uracil-DNA glycosylase